MLNHLLLLRLVEVAHRELHRVVGLVVAFHWRGGSREGRRDRRLRKHEGRREKGRGRRGRRRHLGSRRCCSSRRT